VTFIIVFNSAVLVLSVTALLHFAKQMQKAGGK
jgi:hypothetical protein